MKGQHGPNATARSKTGVLEAKAAWARRLLGSDSGLCVSTRSLISLLLSRLARVLTVSLAAAIKCIFSFGCAKRIKDRSTKKYFQSGRPIRKQNQRTKVSKRHRRSPQQTLLTLGPWSPWSPCKKSRKNNSRKWQLWLQHPR